MKRVTVAILFAATCSPLFGLDPALSQADQLDTAGEYEQARTLLLTVLPALSAPADRAEVLWRLSREQLSLGEAEQNAGRGNDAAIAAYDKGKEYAQQAIDADPSNPEGYFWKSGNMGKVGLIRGPLNSLGMVPTLQTLLSKTVQLNPTDDKAYFALGQLYAKLPGWPISFGNIDYAVSLARKSTMLLDRRIATGAPVNVDFDFYLELARDLYQRNWDAGHRRNEQQSKLKRYTISPDIVEKSFYYEGTINLPDESDRAEAAAIVRNTISMIQSKTAPLTSRDRSQLAEAKKLLAEWH